MEELSINFSALHYFKRLLLFVFAIFPAFTIGFAILGGLVEKGSVFQWIIVLFFFFFVFMVLNALKNVILLIFREEALVLKENVFVDKFSKYKPISISWDDVDEFKIKKTQNQRLMDVYTLHIKYKNLDKYKDIKTINKVNKNYNVGDIVEVELDLANISYRVKDYEILEKYYYIAKYVELDKMPQM